MAEMGKPKKNVSGKGENKGRRIGAGTGKSEAGDTAAKARHGTQGGAAATPRQNSPRVPQGRAGGKGGGPKRG
jgi:hypothetical protein